MRFRHVTLVLLLAVAPLCGQEAVPLSLKGNVVVVKVDRVVVVKEDRTVVQAVPFSVTAPASEGLHFWTYPAGVSAVDKGGTLDVIAAPKGELTISLKVVSADWESKKFVTRFGSITFNVGDIAPPTPPVPPPPTPDPTPTPSPAPIPSPGLRVLVIYEATKGAPLLTAKQQNELYGADLNNYLNANCIKESGQPGWRIWDKDTPLAGAPELWRQAMGKYANDNDIPRLVVSNGTTGWVGPLPAGDGSILAKIKEYSK